MEIIGLVALFGGADRAARRRWDYYAAARRLARHGFWKGRGGCGARLSRARALVVAVAAVGVKKYASSVSHCVGTE